MIRRSTRVVALAVLALAIVAAGALAQDKPAPKVQIPNPGVPQVMTMEGAFVRAAYNNEAYVILGYRTANESVGEPWIVLDVGTTLREGQRAQKLTRDEISMTTPDGKTVPLPSNNEFQAANLAALERRASVSRDSINYFPPSATRACSIGFFKELSQRTMSWDEVEVDSTRACLGRLYFPVAGGIKYGQYLAQHQVRPGRDSRAVPDPHQGRREDAQQELQEHQVAGGRSVQAEEEVGFG